MDFNDPAIRRITGAKSTTFVITDDIAVVTPATISGLKQAAAGDPLKRARLCLHQSSADAVHQMVIAQQRATYVHPHRHRGKSESFNIIEGRLALFFFDDAGKVTRRITMAELGSAEPCIYRLSASLWHTVIPLTDYVVFHEITNGPFVSGDAELAPWAPNEKDEPAIQAFKQKLLDAIFV